MVGYARRLGMPEPVVMSDSRGCRDGEEHIDGIEFPK